MVFRAEVEQRRAGGRQVVDRILSAGGGLGGDPVAVRGQGGQQGVGAVRVEPEQSDGAGGRAGERSVGRGDGGVLRSQTGGGGDHAEGDGVVRLATDSR